MCSALYSHQLHLKTANNHLQKNGSSKHLLDSIVDNSLLFYLCNNIGPVALQQVVDDMGNIKFAFDTGPDAPSSSWLKYVRSAPSFEEQNLAACHLTGDQVSDMTDVPWLDYCSKRALCCQQNKKGKRNIGHLLPPAEIDHCVNLSEYMCACSCLFDHIMEASW